MHRVVAVRALNALRGCERRVTVMKKMWVLALLGLVAIAIAAGCGRDAGKVLVRITDTEGAIQPREITVEYVNERLDRMPPHLVPDIPGEEGKREFVEEIIRKELLVVQGHRIGIHNDPQLQDMLRLYEDDKAEQMFVQEMVYDVAEPTSEDVEEYNVLRETSFKLLQIVVENEDAAWDAYRRITDDGEDFGSVAKDVSIAHSAADGGTMPDRLWPDMHPVVSMNIIDLDSGDVTEPIDIGGPYHLYQVVGRKSPNEPPPLDAQRLAGITAECRTIQRTIREYELNEEMTAAAELSYNEEALAITGELFAAEAARIIPENVAELSIDERMELANIQIIPGYTEDEAAMKLVGYTVGGEDNTWTLDDFRSILQATPGIESPKNGDVEGLRMFVWKKVRDDLIAYEIKRRGYKDSQELKDYLDQRAEEYIVNTTYQREVNEKTEEPSGQEIRDYFRSHRENYAEPLKVDLRQMIVSTEAEANQLRQRMLAGEATFEELVETHSTEQWSKPRGGLVDGYGQGERRLDYLQGVVFDLEIGVLSDPFPAPGGFAIVEVLERYPERLREFSEVGETVVSDVTTARKEARLNELLDEVRATVEIEWIEENLADVKDTAEAHAEKLAQRFVNTS